MRVLIACEYSGRVRDAFAKRGHTAVSCDLRPTEAPHGWHIQGDALAVLNQGWDLMIGHPYCTFNCLSDIRWMYHPEDTHLPARTRGLSFVRNEEVSISLTRVSKQTVMHAYQGANITSPATNSASTSATKTPFLRNTESLPCRGA